MTLLNCRHRLHQVQGALTIQLSSTTDTRKQGLRIRVYNIFIPSWDEW